ncbi:MAG: SCP2 sterol-binding domain-containing protein [Deltaproteobacteria bacterium]|nr:SCP2 sterol-binding domain-containing protein [Deltaproteobacteria bacterium]
MKSDAAIEQYFNQYLPGFLGQPLIKNLMSLSAAFWIDIVDQACWSLVIEKGILTEVTQGPQAGAFGFRTDPETFLAVAGNTLSPQKSFFTGKTKISGNFYEALRTATALEEFFQSYPYPPKAMEG